MASDALVPLVMQVASLFVIACCIFLLSSLISVGAFLAHHKFVSALNYRIKHNYLIFHALSAVFASLVVTIWLSLPHSPRLPFIFQHCHNSNCATHIPAVLDPGLLNLLFGFFAIGMATLCFMLLRAHQKKLNERINSLLRLSPSHDSDNNYCSQATIVNVPQPLILNVGIVAPKLLLSSQITANLVMADVKLLLAYEYAKAKQFENLKVKMVQIACLFWPASIRRLLLGDLHAALRQRAFKEICPFFESQKTNIPPSLLTQMSKDIREFVSKIERNSDHLAQAADAIVDDTNLTPLAYLCGLSYFVCLVIVTSNFTHFLFEIVT